MKFNSKVKEVIFWLMAGGAFLLMVYNTMLYRNTAFRSEPPVNEIDNGTSLSGFSLKKLEGEEFILPTTGRYLVSFLTTGCTPCQMQVESLIDTPLRERRGFLGHKVGYPTLAKGPARPNGNDTAAPNISLLQRSNFYVEDFPRQRPSRSFKEPQCSDW